MFRPHLLPGTRFPQRQRSGLHPLSVCLHTFFEIEDDLEKLPDHISVPGCLHLGIAETDKGHRPPGTRHLFKRRKMKCEHVCFLFFSHGFIITFFFDSFLLLFN